MGFADLVGVTICPEVKERILPTYYFPHIIIVSFAVLRQLFRLFPDFAFVFTFPHYHFTSRAPLLRTVRTGPDYHPFFPFNENTSCIIILVRLCDFMMFPIRAVVISHKPFPWTAKRPGLMSRSC